MSKTPEQVQALKTDIQAWLARNGLAKNVYWHDVQKFFEGKEPTFGHPHYLVFSYDDEFNDMLRGAHGTLPRDLKLELDRLVRDKHGCWMNDYDGGFRTVYDDQPREEEPPSSDSAHKQEK